MMTITLEKLAKIGASMVIDADEMMSVSLEKIAGLCATSGAKLYVKNAHKMMSVTLEKIAQLGKGNVTFDFSDENRK